jgi:L-ornithine Nalpha-acyltransferase
MSLLMMSEDSVSGKVVRLAQTDDEVLRAQKLRYQVFYEEFGAKPDAVMEAEKRDFDAYDSHADHLIVTDTTRMEDGKPMIVGTYRLIRRELLNNTLPFYTSGEFNIDLFHKNGGELLELGRSCVLAEYRTRPVLQLLWRGIINYMDHYKIDLMFGCASLHGTDPLNMKEELSYLYHYHLAPEHLRPRALDERFVEMNMISKDQIDAKQAFTKIPPLIKGYLRLGATIGDGAVIDHQFNTTDVCIVMPSKMLAQRYLRNLSRPQDQDSTKAIIKSVSL